jgi:hypothetical protein
MTFIFDRRAICHWRVCALSQYLILRGYLPCIHQHDALYPLMAGYA